MQLAKVSMLLVCLCERERASWCGKLVLCVRVHQRERAVEHNCKHTTSRPKTLYVYVQEKVTNACYPEYKMILRQVSRPQMLLVGTSTQPNITADQLPAPPICLQMSASDCSRMDEIMDNEL